MIPPDQSLALSEVSLCYHSDNTVSLEHMDPYFYTAVSNSLHNLHPFAFLPSLKSPHFTPHMIHILDHYLHYPARLANPSVHRGTNKSSSITPEYYNLPAADIRTTETAYYFDIELPGVTDKSNISIHWTSSWTFVVEGETPRPRIPIRGQLNGETNGQAYPGSSPLVRCPGSGQSDQQVKRETGDENCKSTTKTGNADLPLDSVAEKASSFEPWVEQNKDEEDSEIILGERMIGCYRRSFNIPLEVDVDVKATEASLEAGVLTIRVPKMEPYQKATLLKIPVK